MRQTTCDRCGVVTDVDTEKLVWLGVLPVEARNLRDLCGECADKFDRWMREGMPMP